MNTSTNNLSENDVLVDALLIGSFTLVSIVISYILMYQFCCQRNNKLVLSNSNAKKNKKMDICSKCLILSCVIISTLSSSADLARHIYCYIMNKGLFYHPFSNYMAFADLLYAFGAILFYLIAMSRLQISFYDTMYAINWYFLCCFYVLIFFFFVLSIYYAIIIYLIPSGTTNTFYKHYATIPFILIGSIDLILNTSLLYIFILKLKQLLSNTLSNCDVVNVKDYENCSKAPLRLLTLMTRHTLLFSLAIITNQIWYIAVITRVYLLPSHSDMHLSNFCFRALSNLSNCMVLWLSLGRNHKIYYLWCGYCHTKIQNCFVENVYGYSNEDNSNPTHFHSINDKHKCNSITTTTRTENLLLFD